MSSSDRKAYKVELGEIDHKPCWSIMVPLLKMGFWEKLICVKAMEKHLVLLVPDKQNQSLSTEVAALWSRQLMSESFDEVLTCRKERFPNGKTPTKLFALFSFWADICILYGFCIIYRPLHTPQKNCWLWTKEEPVTDWMIIVSCETQNRTWVNRFCCVYTHMEALVSRDRFNIILLCVILS